jgi:putative tricarboxylic transport membrane protein
LSKRFDRYAGILFLAVGVFFIIESQKISSSSYGSTVGPNIFPFGLGVILGLLSLRLIYETFRYQQEKEQKERLDYTRFFIILVAAFLYCFFLEDIGYTVATFLFLLIGFQTLKKGKVLTSLIIAASFSIGVFYVFDVLLKVNLPSSASWLGIW